MAYTQPLRQVADAFWTMLEADATFAAAVPAANRIKYGSTSRAPDVRRSPLPGSAPQVRIFPVKYTLANLDATSNATFLNIVWSIQVETPDKSLWTLLDVGFRILNACAKWRSYFSTFTYASGKTVEVNLVDVLNVEQALGTEPDQDITGWREVWQVETRLIFKASDLK